MPAHDEEIKNAVESNWDNLSDQDWNKKLDDTIAIFNKGKGEHGIPPPIHKPIDNEYVRGLNNKMCTEDLIRHFSEAIGDPSPFWRDPTYAAGSRWGGMIAPPVFEACISFGSTFGGRLRVPGIGRLAAGNRHDYFVPIRPGDTFSIYDKYLGFEEKKVTGKPYRLFIESVPRYFVNQRNEIAAIATGRNIYVATPPSKMGGKEELDLYQDKKYTHYSQEVLDQVHKNYDDQISGVLRQGARTRYWEDVEVGEEINPLAKGPLDVCDATAIMLYPYAYAIKWLMMRKHLSTHPIDPETGDNRCRRDWHFDDRAAKIFGLPLAQLTGIQSEMTLVQGATDWMGDDGWVKSMDSQDRRFNFVGDLTWIKGKVTKKYVEDGEPLVELSLRAENQDGEVHTKSVFVIRLISRSDSSNKALLHKHFV